MHLRCVIILNCVCEIPQLLFIITKYSKKFSGEYNLPRLPFSRILFDSILTSAQDLQKIEVVNDETVNINVFACDSRRKCSRGNTDALLEQRKQQGNDALLQNCKDKNTSGKSREIVLCCKLHRPFADCTHRFAIQFRTAVSCCCSSGRDPNIFFILYSKFVSHQIKNSFTKIPPQIHSTPFISNLDRRA